jgi:hypothetical protein
MIGNYLGSAPSVLNAGEYRALYLAFATLPMQLRGALEGLVPKEWEPHRDLYLQQVQRHSVDFIMRTAQEQGRTAFCDSHPRNVLIAPLLAGMFPDALFVLTLRHYTGTIQSLLRLGTISVLPGNEPGLDWYDPTAVAAGVIWDRHYQAAMSLPRDRTVVFGYDRFCADPKRTLARFKAALGAARFPVDELNDRSFADSHASLPGRPRATVGARGGRLASIPSYDAKSWLPVNEREVRPVVGGTDDLLRAVYPLDYAAPAGYPGPEALLAKARALRSPNPRSGAARSRAAAPPARRSGSAGAPARAQRRPPNASPAAGKSSRGRRAKGS